MTTLSEVVNFLELCSKMDFRQNIDEEFHLQHPRYQSFSSMSGSVLDVGAGSGGIGQYLFWPKELSGIELYGSDIFSPQVLPAGYTEYFSDGWQSIPSVKLNAALFIHVIEHVENWDEMLHSVVSKLVNKAPIYIEWPSQKSIEFPRASDVWEEFVSRGYDFSTQLLTTFNFFDDITHLNQPQSMSDVIEVLKPKNVRKSDNVYLEILGTELTAKGLKENDVSRVTLGVWARFGFAQYVLV